MSEPSLARRSCSAAKSSVASIATDRWSAMSPASIRGDIQMTLTPVVFRPSRNAAWIGVAPRYCGSRLGWTFRAPSVALSKSATGSIFPYDTHASSSGRRPAASATNPASNFSGVKTSSPSGTAAAFTGVGVSLRPRPAGRSAWVYTAAMSCAEASALRLGIAKSELPKKIVRNLRGAPGLDVANGFSVFVCASLDGHGIADVGGLVRDQYPVEVVDLVLEAARQPPFRLDAQSFPVAVEPAHDALLRAFDVTDRAGNRKTPFGALDLALESAQHRIDDRVRPAVFTDMHHDDAFDDADLRCCQPDARRRVHRLEHVVDERLSHGQLQPQGRHLFSDLVQDWIRVGEDAACVGHHRMYCDKSWSLTISARRSSTYCSSTTISPPRSGASYETPSKTFSSIVCRRRAPMFSVCSFTSVARRAIASMPLSVNVRETPSVASNCLYCSMSAFFGCVRMVLKSSFVRLASSTRIGNRPCSSGMRSLGLLIWNAPAPMNRTWSVFTGPYLVITVDPSTIGKMSRCTPSREMSGTPPPRPLPPAILSISSTKMMPFSSARRTASRLSESVSTSLAASSCVKICLASATVTRRLLRLFGRMLPSRSPMLAPISSPCGPPMMICCDSSTSISIMRTS